MASVPPEVVVNPVLTEMLPVAVLEFAVLLHINVLKVPAGIYCPPAVLAKFTTPVVPPQVTPAGMAGLMVDVVVMVPLLVTVMPNMLPNNW